MRSSFRKTFAVMTLGLCLSTASAASAAQTVWTSGNVNYISCYNNSVCAVTLSSAAPTWGSCATTGGSFNLNADSMAGQAMLKTLSTAKALGSTVQLYGYSTATCNLVSGQEDLYQVQIH